MPESEPLPQPDADDELRIYIIVRKDVGHRMSKAKFGVQCGHASLMLFTECLKIDPDRAWKFIENSQPKIVLECEDTEHLLRLFEKSVKAGFLAERVTDLGRTEFGQPTLTALVVGPVWYKLEAQNSFLRGLPTYRDEPSDEERRFVDILLLLPKDEITAAACEQLNHGAPCCIRPSVRATTCGHKEWHREFGAEILFRIIERLYEQLKIQRGS